MDVSSEIDRGLVGEMKSPGDPSTDARSEGGGCLAREPRPLGTRRRTSERKDADARSDVRDPREPIHGPLLGDPPRPGRRDEEPLEPIHRHPLGGPLLPERRSAIAGDPSADARSEGPDRPSCSVSSACPSWCVPMERRRYSRARPSMDIIPLFTECPGERLFDREHIDALSPVLGRHLLPEPRRRPSPSPPLFLESTAPPSYWDDRTTGGARSQLHALRSKRKLATVDMVCPSRLNDGTQSARTEREQP